MKVCECSQCHKTVACRLIGFGWGLWLWCCAGCVTKERDDG